MTAPFDQSDNPLRQSDDGGSPSSSSPPRLELPPSYDASNEEVELGTLGPPINKRTPFWIGLTGALGVAVAYVLVRAIADASSVLLIIGVSLFLAIGLNPTIVFLTDHRLNRPLASLVVTLSLIAMIGGFIAAAAPPIANEVHSLVKSWPKYQHDILFDKGTLGHLAKKLHISRDITTKNVAKLKTKLIGGAFGAGKILLSAVAASVSVLALSIYFLVALPAVKRFGLGLVPRSRRDRVEAITDEVFVRVGGFVLGNILTSLIAGVGTFVWLVALGIPYPLLLSLFVALFDLIPIVGSTIAGLVVSLVALSHSLTDAILTVAFYIIYRFLEDYFLTPRIMRHTVKISPGLTIVATLLGGELLGLIGALVAIPVAATIYLVLNEVVFPRLNKT